MTLAPLGPREWTAWFQGKQFTTDWCSRHFNLWAELLAPLRKHRTRALEIGSWEGRSAIFFLEYLPRCRLTCIDTFAGSDEHRGVFNTNAAQSEARFDANLAAYDDRVEKIKARSEEALPRLNAAGRRFDLIYIDGSHKSEDVRRDSELAWPLLKRGGILLWDDYDWFADGDGPKFAVDGFLRDYAGQYVELHRRAQVAIKKI